VVAPGLAGVVAVLAGALAVLSGAAAPLGVLEVELFDELPHPASATAAIARTGRAEGRRRRDLAAAAAVAVKRSSGRRDRPL
jgi:hypothetical protein